MPTFSARFGLALVFLSCACHPDPVPAANASNPASVPPPVEAAIQTPPAPPPAPPEPPPPPPGVPGAIEYRTAPRDLTAYRKASTSSGVRGILAAKEPWAVMEKVGGPGCGGDGWARIQGDAYACLDGTTTTTEYPVVLPRLVAFDPPEPDEYYTYVESNTYDRTPSAEVDPWLPNIYGKPWRQTWKGTLYKSAASYEKGDASIGFLPKDRKYHFDHTEDTSRGTVVVRDDGKASPIEDVFLYPISRHHGRNLETDPVPDGMMPAWAFDYEDTSVYAAPGPVTPETPVAKKIKYHTPLVLPATPADSSGHWWTVPDALGPGVPGYVSDTEGIRHPTVRPPPSGIGADEVWVDVDIGQEILMVYRGPKMIFVTLVSTGDIGWGTPKGLYRIQSKSTLGDMQSRPDAVKPYYVEDVPWVMHFWPRYALHGVFWHWGFGHIASHGCVNLAPLDAKYLFDQFTPTVYPGWKQAVATPEALGTTIRVRNGDVEGPDRRGGGGVSADDSLDLGGVE